MFLSDKYGIDKKKAYNILKEDFDNGLRKRNFNVLLEKLEIKEDVIEKLVFTYRNHKPNISLYPDTKDVLNKLFQNKKLGMITDGYISTQKNKIRELNIEKFFEHIIINDITKESKLDKKCFENIFKKLNTNASESVYVGDNPLKDFITPKKLNLHTVRVKRKDGIYQKIKINKEYDADHTVKNLLDMLSIIEGI